MERDKAENMKSSYPMLLSINASLDTKESKPDIKSSFYRSPVTKTVSCWKPTVRSPPPRAKAVEHSPIPRRQRQWCTACPWPSSRSRTTGTTRARLWTPWAGARTPTSCAVSPTSRWWSAGPRAPGRPTTCWAGRCGRPPACPYSTRASSIGSGRR